MKTRCLIIPTILVFSACSFDSSSKKSNRTNEQTEVSQGNNNSEMRLGIDDLFDPTVRIVPEDVPNFEVPKVPDNLPNQPDWGDVQWPELPEEIGELPAGGNAVDRIEWEEAAEEVAEEAIDETIDVIDVVPVTVQIANGCLYAAPIVVGLYLLSELEIARSDLEASENEGDSLNIDLCESTFNSHNSTAEEISNELNEIHKNSCDSEEEISEEDQKSIEDLEKQLADIENQMKELQEDCMTAAGREKRFG